MRSRLHVTESVRELLEGEPAIDRGLEGMLVEERHELLEIGSRVDEDSEHPQALHRERRDIDLSQESGDPAENRDQPSGARRFERRAHGGDAPGLDYDVGTLPLR